MCEIDCANAFGRRLPQGKLLPPYAVEYFNQLVAQYLTLTDKEKERNPQADALAEALIRQQDEQSQPKGLAESVKRIFGRRNAQHLNWGDLTGLEMCVLRLIPDVCLDHLKCSLNGRYHDLAGENWHDDTCLPAAPSEMDYEDLRANLAMMLADIQRRRSLILARETQRNFITWIGAVGAILTVAVGLLLAIFSGGHHNPAMLPKLLPICFVLLSGASGGLISMLRRLQGTAQGTDQSRDTIMMGAGQSTLLLSPLYGAIFASVLYLIFEGRLLNAMIGDMTGVAGSTPGEAGAVVGGVNSPLFPNFPAAGLLGTSEFAKLLVWSFVAGFAEKFVPDVLDRITARSRTDSGNPPANLSPAKRLRQSGRAKAAN